LAVVESPYDVRHLVQVIHRNDLGRIFLAEVSEHAWDDLQVLLHLVDPLFPESVVILEPGHLINRVECLECLDEGVYVPVAAPVGRRMVLDVRLSVN